MKTLGFKQGLADFVLDAMGNASDFERQNTEQAKGKKKESAFMQRLRDMGVISFCGEDVKDVVVRDAPDSAAMEAAKRKAMAEKADTGTERLLKMGELLASIRRSEAACPRRACRHRPSDDHG